MTIRPVLSPRCDGPRPSGVATGRCAPKYGCASPAHATPFACRQASAPARATKRSVSANGTARFPATWCDRTASAHQRVEPSPELIERAGMAGGGLRPRALSRSHGRRRHLGGGILAKLLQQLAVDVTGLRLASALLVAHDGAGGHESGDAVGWPGIEAEALQSLLDFPHFFAAQRLGRGQRRRARWGGFRRPHG